MPDIPALQRIPKGKYYMMPDAMPQKASADATSTAAITPTRTTYADPILNAGKMVVYGQDDYYNPFSSTGRTVMLHNDYYPRGINAPQMGNYRYPGFYMNTPVYGNIH